MRCTGALMAGAIIGAVLAGIVLAQAYDPGTELALVEKLTKARDDYKSTLTELYNYYLRSGDAANTERAREELTSLKAVPQYDYATAVQGVVREPIKVVKYVEEADDYFADGKIFAGSNRKATRDIALKRFEKILTAWPDSDKASAAAYEMGEVYSGLYYWDYDLAAKYYLKAYELDPSTSLPALVRAGDMYYKVKNYDEAVRVYKLAVEGSVDEKARDRAQAQLDKLAQKGK